MSRISNFHDKYEGRQNPELGCSIITPLISYPTYGIRIVSLYQAQSMNKLTLKYRSHLTMHRTIGLTDY